MEWSAIVKVLCNMIAMGFNDAIMDLPWKYKCVDDTLLYDTIMEEAFWQVYK